MTNSEPKDLFPTESAGGERPTITLEIRGLIIPNFKNSKRWLTKLPNGQPLKRPILVTDHEVQNIMGRIVRDFESGLLSAIQTDGGATLTEHSKRLRIASVAPSDDCWEQIPEITIEAQLCQPGEEGCTLTIQRI